MGHRIALVLAAVGALLITAAHTAVAGGGTQGMGTVTCAVAGQAKFKPALTNLGTVTPVTAKLKGKFAMCSGTGDGMGITAGKLIVKISIMGTNGCNELGGFPAFDATIKWKGSAKLDASTVHFAASPALSSGPYNSVVFQFIGTMDAAGSFPGQSVTLAVDTDETLTDIETACLPTARGLEKYHFTGVNAASTFATP